MKPGLSGSNANGLNTTRCVSTTLKDVASSYNVRFALGLIDGEMNDLVEYLKSLFSNGSAVNQP